MKAFLLALLALVVISVGANQILERLEAGGVTGGTASDNVRLN
ncbi:MAG: hypothetical protein ABJF86_03550 [Tateyamaria sp.]